MLRRGSPVGVATLLAYSLPFLPATLLGAPLGVVQGLYAKHFGLSLTTIAGVLLFARLLDACADPVIGSLSDRWRARTGTRKPFVIAGSLVSIVAGYLLYVPPASAGVLYFATVFITFYAGWALLHVPYMAWGGELGVTSIEKTRIFTFRTVMAYAGPLVFYAVPLLPFFTTAEITLDTLRWAAIAAAALMLPFLYVAVTRVPDGHVVDDVCVLPASRGRHGLLGWFRLFGGNRPFLILMAALLITYMSAGIWSGLFFIYVDSYLELGPLFARMSMLALVVGIVCAPLWYRLARWLGTKGAWVVATTLMIASYVYAGILRPGEIGFVELSVLKTLNTVGVVALQILVPTVLSETVDYGTWKLGVSRGATYFGAYTLGVKLMTGIGAAAGLAVAGWSGFDPTAQVHTEQAILGLRASIVWLPLGFAVVSAVFVFLIPMNARRHNVIRRRLEAREAWLRGRSPHPLLTRPPA